MSGYETKALLLAVLRFSQEVQDPRKTEKLIEELLTVDGFSPDAEEPEAQFRRISNKKRPDPIRGA